MQQNLNEYRRLKYLQAMGIPVWVQRLPGDEIAYANASKTEASRLITAVPTSSGNGSITPQRPVSRNFTTQSMPQGMQETLEAGNTKVASAASTTTGSTENRSNATVKKVSKEGLIDCSQMDWQALQTHVSSCQSCSLHDSRSQAVLGSGDTSAEYLIIGDTPSAEDDRRGHPFQGKEGRLLTNMLLAIDMPRDTVYLTNTIKCRPPNNRAPLEEELAHCQNALWRQIELIKPKAILILGRVTAQSLLKIKAPFSTLRGQVHSLSAGGLGRLSSEENEMPEIPTVVTYHPKTLLKQTKDKRKAWEDLKLFKKINT